MEVILIENIEKLGKVGDVVKVKDGYARNYLIPKKKVLRASKENLKVFEEKKSEIEAEEKKRKDKSEEIAKQIKNLEIIIIRNAADNGQLYGSVTSINTAEFCRPITAYSLPSWEKPVISDASSPYEDVDIRSILKPWQKTIEENKTIFSIYLYIIDP